MVERLRRSMRMQSLPLIIGFTVLALIVGARAVLVENQRLDNDSAHEAIELERHLSSILALARDAEAGQRGYLLTGDKAYLEPYDRARAALPAEIDAIDRATADNGDRAGLIGPVKEALAERLADMADVLRLWDAGDRTAALEIVRSKRGLAAMERLRGSLDVVRRAEGAALQARFARVDLIESSLRLGSIAALLAVFLLAIYSIGDSRRRLRAVVTAQSELAEKNAALASEIRTREKAEAQIRQMHKMEAVGQLTGGLAHDFNNMLAVIISAMNLAQRKLSRGEHDVEKFIEAATDAASRAADLTARLLAFSRQQPLAPQVVDANRLVSGMSDLLRRALGEAIRVETVLAGGLWRTRADPSQLENAILNLAVNARDAMAGEGKLTIETANSHLDDQYAATHTDVGSGQYVMIALTDTGSGMSPDIIAKAFEPFFTTKPVNKGTGLGLSQVYGFVKQSGGHVKIYSEPGQGTTVRVYLPRYFGTEEPAAPAAPVTRTGTPSRELILVVEDDERVRVSTTEALRELGYSVIHVGSGDDALRKLGENPNIVLLFTDIVMPGMNGRKLAEEAVARVPGLKVVFTTGFTRNAVVHNGVLDHDVNFLAKPFTIEQLAAKMREILDAAK